MNKVNKKTPIYVKKLGHKVEKTNIENQKINIFLLKTYDLVIATFQVFDKLDAFCNAKVKRLRITWPINLNQISTWNLTYLNLSSSLPWFDSPPLQLFFHPCINLDTTSQPSALALFREEVLCVSISRCRSSKNAWA